MQQPLKSSTFGRAICLAATAAAIALSSGTASFAAPVSVTQARLAVQAWLGRTRSHLGDSLGTGIAGVDSYRGADGTPMYYVARLSAGGYVVASADDRVEPILCFARKGSFDPDPANPLVELINTDLADRLRAAHAKFGEASQWRALLSPQTDSTSLQSISDVWVAPFVQTQWNQGDSGSVDCYNCYTPDNYFTGCVATAMAQLMVYWQWPQVGVGTASFPITINGASAMGTLRGGDGLGGPYDWAEMPDTPDTISLTSQEFDEIGDLSSDAGVATNMQYSYSGSGTYMSNAESALKGVFGYGNVVASNGAPTYTQLKQIIYPDLDCGLPVMLSIFTSTEGHCVLADGYGEDSGAMYTHINVGWGTYYDGINDIWYNLADPNLTQDDFTIIGVVLYNVEPQGGGEIVSGMVEGPSGNYLSGVPVTISGGGITRTDVSSTQHGIYGFAQLPSNTRFTVSATWNGETAAAIAHTGVSSDYASCGNIWAKNLVFTGTTGPSLLALVLNPASVTGGASTTATVSLTEGAGSAGFTVKLKSGNAALAEVQAPTLTFAPGSSEATFTVSTSAVGAKSTVPISVSAGGVSKSAVLAVHPPPVKWIALKPTEVTGGAESTATVALSAANPLDTTVDLTSRGYAASVPATITIPAGSTKATFTVVTSATQQPTQAEISASDGGAGRSATLSIAP